MGHDITAYRPDVDKDSVREKYDINRQGDDWLDRYNAYCNETQIAYLRRGAGNPLNQVLYLALGVMDDAYAGCSGNGSELEITLDQFKNGLEVLEKKSFVGVERERNMSDDLIDTLTAAFGQTTSAPPELVSEDDDISQEVRFITDCIKYLEGNNLSSMKVCFG